jgi:hypothetical protein
MGIGVFHVADATMAGVAVGTTSQRNQRKSSSILLEQHTWQFVAVGDKGSPVFFEIFSGRLESFFAQLHASSPDTMQMSERPSDGEQRPP